MSGHLCFHNEQWNPWHVAILVAIFLSPYLCGSLERGWQACNWWNIKGWVFRTSGVSREWWVKINWSIGFPPLRSSQLIFMLILVEGVMPLVKKERFWHCSYTAGRCSVCVTWDKLIVILHVCMVWEMWHTQAAPSWCCGCYYETQGTHELLRKPALKPEPTPAEFPEQLQKLLIGSYEYQLMIISTVKIHRWGTCALSKKGCLHLPFCICTINCLHCVPSLLLWSCLSSCLYLLLCPLLPPSSSSSPVPSGFSRHPPPREPAFLLTTAIWSGLLALLPGVTNTDPGLRQVGSPSLQYQPGAGPVWL